ncbi:MAG: flagellar basal-body rod protein FlgF [Gammaproteobacteria bacterium]|nr:flagellar basal-body rod protein FlgF [Gammaproteobacteria bacterium]
MDRMLYIGMSAAKENMLAHGINSNNLANVSTTGFRADLEQFRSMPVFGPGLPTRAYAMAERPGIDFTAGPLESTGRDLDVAIQDQGWLVVEDENGQPAYTRAGRLDITAEGFLVNGSGYRVLGNGGPIAIPPAESVFVSSDGNVSIKPAGQQGAALALVDRLYLVNPPKQELEKGRDGLIRRKDGVLDPIDLNVKVQSGALEKSNVSPVEAMVKMIEISRSYELNVKVMSTAEEVDQSSSSLMSLS